MKTTEDVACKVAVQVMNDLRWTFDTDLGPSAFFTDIESQVERWKDLKGFDQIKDRIYEYWTVIFEFPKEDGWEGRNMMWVRIMDYTGEPYEIGHRQWKGKITKDENGKYQKHNRDPD